VQSEVALYLGSSKEAQHSKAVHQLKADQPRLTQAATNMKVQDDIAPCRHIGQAVYIVRLNI